ncbi:MAG: MOSC domain-containing protein, partial [Planctomycetota bacterium]|nr:MOSC domain-containing protein [Planctomycetota bacterium]
MESLGLVGDKHRHPEHGGENRAVCLFSTADYAALQRDGVPAKEPGSFGENLLIDGLDFARLNPGDRLAVGDQVLLEVHDCREPCITLQPVDERFPALMEGRSGFLCRVIRGGMLAP